MNENNQNINQTNEDLEKTVLINSDDINNAAEQVQAPISETPVQDSVQEPIVEPVVVAPVQEPAQEPVVEPVVASPIQETVTAPVQEQTVIENIPGQSNDIGTVQNIVADSAVDVTTPEAKPTEVKEYKDPSKLSTVLVIILFIALFVFVFEMPKINEWLETRNQQKEINTIEQQAKQIEEAKKNAEEQKKAQEQKAKEEKEKKEAELKTLTCTKTVEQKPTTTPATDPTATPAPVATYSKKVEETFNYNGKSLVVSSTSTTTYTFTSQDENYTKIKTNCETDSTKYMEKAGFSMSCMSSDLTVTVGNEFDLSTFKDVDDLKANAKLNENINDVKTRLTSNGYTCK